MSIPLGCVSWSQYLRVTRHWRFIIHSALRGWGDLPLFQLSLMAAILGKDSFVVGQARDDPAHRPTDVGGGTPSTGRDGLDSEVVKELRPEFAGADENLDGEEVRHQT